MNALDTLLQLLFLILLFCYVLSNVVLGIAIWLERAECEPDQSFGRYWYDMEVRYDKPWYHQALMTIYYWPISIIACINLFLKKRGS